MELAVRARDGRRISANVQESVKALAAADAGVAHTRLLLDRRLQGGVVAVPGRDAGTVLDPWIHLASVLPDSQGIEGAVYRVRLRDAGSALHLNRCTEDELRRLLVALRVDAGVADRIAQAAMDWRDADDLHRGRGAERNAYVRAGAAVMPRNAPFLTVGELRDIRGVTPEIFTVVAPHLTVLGTGRVNLNSAPAPVLLALPGMSNEAVALVLRRRRSGVPFGSIADVGPQLSPGARDAFQAEYGRLSARTTTTTHEVEIRSIGRPKHGRVSREVEVLLVRGGTATFLIGRRAL
jgi:general secretion pathway protein K